MSMKRSLHSTARTLFRLLGYPPEKLDAPFNGAFFTYLNNGAIKKVGEIESAEILHRNSGSNPIHKSHYNRKDQADIISVRIKPKNGSAKTHHIYGDGTGTMHVRDKKEYSTYSTKH